MARSPLHLWRKFLSRFTTKSDRSLRSEAGSRKAETKIPPQQQYDPIILSTSHLTTTQPAEFFAEPSKGNCTWHSLISSPMTKSDTFTVGIGVCEPKVGTLAMHRHEQAEFYYVLSGSGVVRIEGQDHTVKVGDAIFIPSDAEHGVFNYGLDEFKWLYCFGVDGFQDIVYRFTHNSQT